MTDLPSAPAIEKEDIPDVCQSENFVFRGEVTVRTTFNVFVKGILSQIVADHNRRSLCTILEVDGKIVMQWDGVTLDKLAETPYTFYINGQKFVLLWIVQPEDSDKEDCFDLQADGTPLSELDYLDLDFKLTDEDVTLFQGTLVVNGQGVITENFEWRPASMSHKIL